MPAAAWIVMRVSLHVPRESDAAEFLRHVRDSLSMHRPWVYPPTAEPGYLRYLQTIRMDRHAGFLARRVEDGAMVGLVNINEIARGAMQSAYLGYWGTRAYAGRGYMTEAVALAFDHAFGELGLHRLEVNIQPENRRSIALAERLRLRREGFSKRYLLVGGEWKDHERYAILAEDWRERGGAAMALADVVKG